MKKTGLNSNKSESGIELVNFEPVHNIISKNKIDWEDLSVENPEPIKTESQNELKTELPLDKEGFVPASKSRLVFEDDNIEVQFEPPLIKQEKVIKTRRRFTKYIFASSIIFILSAVTLGYIFLGKNNQVVEVKKENVQPIVTPPLQVSDNLVTDSLVEMNLVENFEQVPPKEETEQIIKNELVSEESKPITKKDLVTEKTKPPLPPEIINVPLIEPTLEVPKEESRETSESTNPPKEEITEISEEPAYFVAVEEMPEPIGGLAEIQKKIEYPEIARRAGLEGKVFVRAYVNETGDVTKAEIVKGLGGGCDEVALDAILKTKFTPGKQRGKPIKVQVTIPISFKL